MSKHDDRDPPRDAEELLRRYRSGERYFAGAEIDDDNYDLRGVALRGADLSRSYVTADFRGADLRDVSFAGANVKTCDFRGADLRNALFRGAALESALFDGANLDGADFSGASCYGHTFGEGDKPQ